MVKCSGIVIVNDYLLALHENQIAMPFIFINLAQQQYCQICLEFSYIHLRTCVIFVANVRQLQALP